MYELELNKFDPNIFNKNCGKYSVILVVGSKGSGKTVLIKDIMSYIKVPTFFVMSGTEEGTEFYRNIVNPEFIYNKFEPEVLTKLVNNQKKKAIKLRLDGRSFRDEHNEHVCVILEDIIYDKSIMNQEAIKKIFFDGRLCGMTLIIVTQYMMDLKPEMRANIDYVFVKRSLQHEKLYKNFFGMFDKLADFKKILNACTDDHGCLVLDNISRSERIKDKVFWYKAKTDVL